MVFRVLCAGAAKGLVQALRPQFLSTTDVAIDEIFGAAGAIKEKLLIGTPCDVIVLTAMMIDELTHQGHVLAGSSAPLGRVATGVAVRSGAPLPDVSDSASFSASLQAAQGIYVSDPEHSTAGIHVVNVLKQLGIYGAVKNRLRRFPNGAAAMLELSKSNEEQLLGCTQISEIHYTEGVALVGPFPKEFELATVYSVGVCSNAAHPELAHSFVHLLASSQSEGLRVAGGFEL